MALLKPSKGGFWSSKRGKKALLKGKKDLQMAKKAPKGVFRQICTDRSFDLQTLHSIIYSFSLKMILLRRIICTNGLENEWHRLWSARELKKCGSEFIISCPRLARLILLVARIFQLIFSPPTTWWPYRAPKWSTKPSLFSVSFVHPFAL